MIRIISTFVVLLFAANAFASYSEDDVVKRKSIKASIPISRMNEPYTQSPWTDVYFEFMILKDSSLWLRPLLSQSESYVKFAGASIDRSEPVEIKIKGFAPVEFFELGRRLFLVVKHANWVSDERFIVELKPNLGPKPSVLNTLTRGGVVIPYAAAALFQGNGWSGNIAAALFGIIGSFKLVSNICSEMDDCQATTNGETTLERNSEGYPLTIVKYIFDPAKTGVLTDVILRGPSEVQYSLRTGEQLHCESIVSPSESSGSGIR